MDLNVIKNALGLINYMGMCINYGFRCDTENCVKKIIKETGKIADKMSKKYSDFKYKIISPFHIWIHPHEGSEPMEIKFEPWKKALKQSFFLETHDYGIIKNGKLKVYPGEGVAGNLIPDVVYNHMKKGLYYKQTSFGRMRFMNTAYNYKEINKRPLLGKGGLQTGDTPKTQYGGIEAHIRACAVLEPAKHIADKWIIDDEGRYCGTGDKYNLGNLTDNLEEYTKIVASIGGMLRDKGWKDDQITGPGEETRQRIKGAGK